MAHKYLKPLSEEEFKAKVEGFINSFIELNRNNYVDNERLKENYHKVDIMLYHILKGSNGIVDSVRLIDIILTLVVNYMIENDMMNSDLKTTTEPDARFLYFLSLLLTKYTRGFQGPKKDEWINGVINLALKKNYSPFL